MNKLKRELKFFDILCIGVNAIVGSGIFLFPGILMSHMGPASIFAFFACWVLLVPVAICFSRLASRYETTGGTYLYARDAFGPWIGFAVGWMAWLVLVLSFAAVANAISAYLGHFSGFFSTWFGVKLVAVTVILALGLLNYRGIKLAARTTDFFTVAKLIPLAIFVVVGLFFIRKENLTPFAPHGLSGFGPAVFLAWFAYQGFEGVPVASGEAKSPRKDAPLAVILSLFICMCLYILIQLVVCGVHPGAAGSSKPLAEVGSVFLGPWGASMIAVTAAISTLGFTVGTALITPRYVYALSVDGYLPKMLSKTHKHFGTPYNAILISTIVAAILAVFLDFEKLVDLSNITVGVQYLATCASAWMLCKAGKNLKGRALSPFFPAFGIGAAIYLMWQAQLGEWLWTLAAMFAGIAITLIYRKTVLKK
ncbi:APC family permease [Elusimicrobiota bacterium]